MNNNIILDTKNNSIIAICKDATTAHQMAETYSYIHNKNAWYGLFDIRLASIDEVDQDVIDAFDRNLR